MSRDNMGTNFYTLSGKHVGKRSAAGLYCWDCNVTLCRVGNKGVHFSKNELHDKCPKCGKKVIFEDFSNSSAGRELGFNNSKPKVKSGVASCSSFNWAMDPEKFKDLKIKYIKDEYKRKYTLKEFDGVLEECPIQYTHSVGQEFS